MPAICILSKGTQGVEQGIRRKGGWVLALAVVALMIERQLIVVGIPSSKGGIYGVCAMLLI